jgi:hypothetical protein
MCRREQERERGREQERERRREQERERGREKGRAEGRGEQREGNDPHLFETVNSRNELRVRFLGI